MIILATHALFLNNKDIYGPAHTVSAFLNKTQKDHIFIKHRAEGICLSKIEHYKSGKLHKEQYRGVAHSLPSLLRYLLEMYISISIFLRSPKGYTLFIGADPLNALAGNIGKIISKVEKTVFLSADFSLKRFDNFLMSYSYLFLDRLAMFKSEQTWSVSRRIVEYRKAQGLGVDKNKILPNAPFFDDIKRVSYKQINKHDLVLVSALKKGIVPFTLLIDVVEKLQKDIKDVRLLMIGSGSEDGMLKEYVDKKKLNHCIVFYGVLSHDKMFSVLVKSAIGIAVYEKTNKTHFRYFSDSMRTRDYLASGLPVFFSGASGVSAEILERNAGRIVRLETNALVSSLKDILNNSILYQKLRQNALGLAQKYDTFALLKKYFILLS